MVRSTHISKFAVRGRKMKFLSLILCICLTSCNADLSYTADFTADDALVLAKQLSLKEIEDMKVAVGAGESSAEKREIVGPDGQPVDLSSLVVIDPKGHFCCHQEHIKNKNWNTKQETKVVHEYRTVTHLQKTGYTKCGGLGWGRCSLYKEAYAQQLFTYTQVVEIEDVRFCPDEHITCCHGYTKVADGNCLRLDDLHTIPALGDSLCRMARLGLLEAHKKPENCPSDA